MLYTIIKNTKKGENLTTETWTEQEWSIKEMKMIKKTFGFETIEVSDNVLIMQGYVEDTYHQWVFIDEE